MSLDDHPCYGKCELCSTDDILTLVQLAEPDGRLAEACRGCYVRNEVLKIPRDVTIVSQDDWTTIWHGDVQIYSGHRPSTHYLCKQLGFEVNEIWVDDEDWQYPDNLEQALKEVDDA